MNRIKSVEFLGDRECTADGILEGKYIEIADLDCAEYSEVLITLVDGTQLLFTTSEWAQVFIVKPEEA